MAVPRLLILVPARGGSKGIPRKNVRLLAGKPLLSWTADCIHAAAVPDSVAILSTDDEEIAEVGRRSGLEVPFLRPAEHATDQASAEAVACHALDWFEVTYGASPEAVMLLQPTSPFRPASAITSANEIFSGDASIEAVLGVKTVHRSLATLYRMGLDQHLIPLASGDVVVTRRQEAQPLYTPNGAMYMVRSKNLRENRTFFPLRSVGLVMDSLASLDIDEKADWVIAEAVAVATAIT